VAGGRWKQEETTIIYQPPATTYIQKAGLVVDADLLAVGILNGGIVLVDEVVLDELDGEGTLAHSAAADNDYFVLGHDVRW
jgi:hypothetical protein